MSDETKIYTFEELEKDLKQSHKDFAREYFISGWNRVKSYMKYYPDSTYQAAAVSANELLKNPKIAQYVDFLKEDIEKACNINKGRQLNELAKIAYSSIAHLHNTWIELKEFESLTNEQKEAIESIDTKTEVKQSYNFETEEKEMIDVRYVKIKLYSKLAALDQINKMLGYNAPEKHEGTTVNYNAEVSKEEAKNISDALEDEV